MQYLAEPLTRKIAVLLYCIIKQAYYTIQTVCENSKKKIVTEIVLKFPVGISFYLLRVLSRSLEFIVVTK